MPKLVVLIPASGEVPYELEEGTITIGRLPDNNILIDDSSVSSHHAKLVKAGNDYKLQDLNSTNGTRVNGEPATLNDLQDGDVVQFGQVEARYKSETPSSRQPLPAASGKTEVTTAKDSHRPSDFTNASPFKTKGKRKDPAGMAVIALAVVAILAFAGAVAMILSVQPPQ